MYIAKIGKEFFCFCHVFINIVKICDKKLSPSIKMV